MATTMNGAIQRVVDSQQQPSQTTPVNTTTGSYLQPMQVAPNNTQTSMTPFNQAAKAQSMALGGTQAAMNYQPERVTGFGYTPSQAQSQGYNAAQANAAKYNAAQAQSQGYDASTIGGANSIQEKLVNASTLPQVNMSSYMNPYTENVVNASLQDLERNRLMQQNDVGTQASKAGAFGGSRHGVAESLTNESFARQAASTAANLRQAGYTQAQQAAQSDLARMLQAGQANQSANLAAQQSTASNTLAAQQANQNALNQASQFGAGAANTMALQNMAAQNQANQFGASASNTAALQNMAAQNQASQFGASAANTRALQNMAAQNAAGQFNAGAQNTAALSNQSAGLNAAQMRQSAAQQMGNLGQQSFGYGQSINQDLMNQGTQQQALQQALIDAAKSQYGLYTAQPASSLSLMTAALGGTPYGQTTTNTKQLGMMDYLTAGASLAAMSDSRLKTNLEKTGVSDSGLNTYKWDWNDEGQRITGKKTGRGVIAQEVAQIDPDAVIAREDGYLMVDYGHPLLKGVDHA
jgi:hypothetical protein